MKPWNPIYRGGVEVIIVDDGTKDRSGIMADEFAARHKDCVKVFHKENGGVSSARNAGLEMASGEYVFFADPDDWIDSNYCQCILDAIEKYSHPDMILFDYADCKGAKTKVRSISFLKEDGYMPKEEFFNGFVAYSYIRNALWTRVIKRSFFENVCFREDVRTGEDAQLLNDIVINMNNIVYIKKTLYYYRIRENSLVRTQRIEDIHKVFLMGLERVDKYKNLVNTISLNMPVYYCWHTLRLAYIENKEIYIKQCEKYICDNIFKILFDEHMQTNLKKQCILVCLGVARTYIIWKYRKE